jgi:putative ABC transport system permease protein
MRKRFRLDQIFMDVRMAFRQLRHAPGFAAVVVATLALGVGANSAVFALADAALLRPLPFAEPDRLVMAWERRGATATTMPSPVEFRAWSERLRSFEAVTAMAQGASVTMTGRDGLAVLVPSMTVHVRFFDVLGVPPLRGRTFQNHDVTPLPTAIVMSEAMWRERFGADPEIVGRSVLLSGRAMTVIGVMPARFSLVAPLTDGTAAVLDPPELWTVGSFGVGGGAERAHYVHVIGRLRRGVSIETAQRELDGIARDLARESTAQVGHETRLQPLRDALVGTEVRQTSLVLLGVVGFLLLMCTANLANLLLARTAARARELAVRSALGASRGRIATQLLTESLTLAAVGGMAGAALAVGILRVASSIVPPGLLPNALDIPFDGRVAFFCGVVTLIVGVAFGLTPAWPATGLSVARATGAGGRMSRRTVSVTGLLVTAEVAAAVLVVSGSGLLLRTWSALDRIDPGFRATDLFTASVVLPFPTGPAARYPTADAIRRFQQAVDRELERQPQVRRVAWASSLPLDGGSFAQNVRVAGEPARPDGLAQTASYNMVSPSFFDTLGITIVRGRGFSPGDSTAGAPACIVSEAFVRRYLQGREPLGLRIEVPMMAFGPPQPVLREIVGVVRQTKNALAEPAPVPHVYVPLDQNTWWATSLVVEPAGIGAEALVPIVRAAVAQADPLIALRRPRTIARLAADATARPRFRAVLVSSFGVVGLTLAMVGIFGVLANAVGQRTRELGICIALGARPRQVVSMVAGSVARSVGAGTAIGLGLAALLARSMTTFLFGVEPLDPLTFAAAAGVLSLTAIVAAVVPSLRAVRVDPVTAFRSE